MARRLFGVKRLVYWFGFAILAKALAAVFATYPTQIPLPLAGGRSTTGGETGD